VAEKGGKDIEGDDQVICPITDMLGFDPRELNMLGFELDDDEIQPLSVDTRRLPLRFRMPAAAETSSTSEPC
jgi:hypothetical protein